MAPQDHGFVAGGQVLVVAGGAPVAELVADAYRVIAPRRLVAWLDVDEAGTPDCGPDAIVQGIVLRTERISLGSGQACARQPCRLIDCCCITGAYAPRPGQ
jgi:hypothetical protein